MFLLLLLNVGGIRSQPKKGNAVGVRAVRYIDRLDQVLSRRARVRKVSLCGHGLYRGIRKIPAGDGKYTTKYTF
jgi:hypothetical protein